MGSQLREHESDDASRDLGPAAGADLPVRLVVADDEEAFRILFRVQASALDGLELVGEAKDGAEAVELALALRADAVLLDCLMPGTDGFAAARLIREALPTARLYLHTAAQTAQNVEAAEALGLALLDKLRLDETLTAVAARRGSELPRWEQGPDSPCALARSPAPG